MPTTISLYPIKESRYYFFNKQLINTYYNEKSVEPKDFSTEDQQRGVEMLEKANAYKKASMPSFACQLIPLNSQAFA